MGLTLVLNGLLTLLGGLASWPVLLGVLTAASLLVLARFEVAEVDRSTSKPTVERH